jgi:hypothetical protein
LLFLLAVGGIVAKEKGFLNMGIQMARETIAKSKTN